MPPTAVLATAALSATAIAVGVAVVVPHSGDHTSKGAVAVTSPIVSSSSGDAPSSQAADASGGSGAATVSPSPTPTPSAASVGSPAPSPVSSGATKHTSAAPAHVATTAPAAHSSSASGTGLDDPRKKEVAMELVSSAENSSLNWRAQYAYIEDIKDGRGYTGGIIGFCSGTGDMLELVQHYTALAPNNVLAKYLGALKADNGSDTHNGLDPNFTADWKTAAADPLFQRAQDDERDRSYFNPAVSQGKADGLGALGQFIYYDALVMHGPGSEPLAFGGIRSAALGKAKPPSQGGDETTYLNAFLDARIAAMKADPSHQDTSRIDTEQRVFVKNGNLALTTPLRWSVYGDAYVIN
ncbi:MAG: chitosanase [Catenulispora sp.]|nr:chitosanase [Catenulispora sp.]